MNTAAFSTRNEVLVRKDGSLRPHIKGTRIIGLDMGYSGPKCFHARGQFVFPNYCRKITGELFGELSKLDIIYEDLASGDKYSVGTMALNSLTDESVVAEDALYGRNHYLHPAFRVVFETALGIALWGTGSDGTDVFLQTGLPPAYLTKDEPYLRSVAEGRHRFRLTADKITKEFDITLTKSQIDVMSQPMGTLTSLLFDESGAPTSRAVDLMRSNLLVFDGGFGTLDKFFIRANQLEARDTDPNLGMKRILEETRTMIEEDLGTTVPLPAMQKVLKDGRVRVNDLITLEAKEYPVEQYLEKACTKVCAEAFESIRDYIFSIRYLIMTGGTSDAWIDYFKNRLAASKVEVISGKEGSGLPTVYANARGYYYSRLRNLGFRPGKG